MSDLEQAIKNAWDDLADAECEHDASHAERAVAELIRLHQLSLPQQRSGQLSTGRPT